MSTLETSPEPRRGSVFRYALLVALPILVGLAVSALLLIDYIRPAPVFCEVGGGCDRIKWSVYSSLFHVPVPAYGMAGFALLGVLAMLRGPRVRAIHLIAASLGGLFALYLLSIQAKMETFCPYCVVVDVSAILTVIACSLRMHFHWDPPAGVRASLAGGAALLLAAAVPLAVGFQLGKNKKVAVPASIAAELRQTPPGLVTVVDFVDFECPFCRQTHATFAPLLEENAAKIRLVRKMVPLVKIHPNAMNAARAACCGERLHQGKAMAEKLFTAEDLSAAGCEAIAESLGLDREAFRACVKDPAIDERIKEETAAFRSTGSRGLPTIWIDSQVFEGAQEPEVLEQAMHRAIAGKS
jgi:protein-disulfide isomerase